MEHTLNQYTDRVEACKEIFINKTKDYGTAWRILRPSSLTDQLYIKAARIRSIEEKGSQKVGDSVAYEFQGIVNYSVLASIQLELTEAQPMELPAEEVETLYDKIIEQARNLMIAKNHDYGEAWRSMRVSSLTDLILMKLLRVKQIEDNAGSTLVSEGVDANYLDIINYAVFALIKIKESNP